MTKYNLITREKMSNGSFFSQTFFFRDLIYKVSSCMSYIQCFKAHSNLSVFQWSSFGVLYKPSEVTYHQTVKNLLDACQSLAIQN